MASYPLAVSSWGDEELEAIQQVIASGRFTMGERVRAFERAFADYAGAKYAVMVNSGSSANLLAIGALTHMSNDPLRPGDEVIVPAVSWGTTYYPVHQYGLTLRFVDVDLRTLNLSANQVAAACTPRTRAVFAVNLLGNPCELDTLTSICSDRGLILVEDNCEALGATYGAKQAGTYGRVGTYSFFFSHHISTMEGGMCVTDDLELAEIMTSLRAHGWTRELPASNSVHAKSGSEFDDLFRFVLPGYNLRPLELEAAIGLVQLAKFPMMLGQRRANADVFLELFGDCDDVVVQHAFDGSSWFGFSLVLDGRLRGRREDVVQILARHDIESRPIVAGNFVKNPVCQLMRHEVFGSIDNAERIDEDGLFVGNHHYALDRELQHLAEALADSCP